MPQNEMPIMNIRAKYADETGSGQNIDEALANIAQTLLGKFARVVNASDIPEPLTDEWIEIIQGGVFVNGEYKGVKNPAFFSADGRLLCIGWNKEEHTSTSIMNGNINLSTKVLTVYSQHPIMSLNKSGLFNIDLYETNGMQVSPRESTSLLFNLGPNAVGQIPHVIQGGVANQYAVRWTANPAVNFTAEYDATSTYSLGALVLHDGLLYKCTTAIATAEEWDATHWTAVTMAELLSGITASQIDSGSATSGQVLTADGSGGAQWSSPSSPHLYQHSIFWDHTNNQGSQKWRLTINILLTSATPVANVSDMLGVIDLFAIDGSADERSGGISVNQNFVCENTGASKFMVNMVKRGNDYRVTYQDYSSSQYYLSGEGIELTDSSDTFIDTVTQLF